MEFIVTIILILLFLIYLASLGSTKKTKRERYGEAVSHLAKSAANSISQVAYNLTVPADKKRYNKAMEVLAVKNTLIFREPLLTRQGYLERCFEIDERFKKALIELNLSEERWKKLATELLYIGLIIHLSQDSEGNKHTEDYRNNIINKWRYESPDDFWQIEAEYLLKALNYYNVSEQDWIKYGDSVVGMYNLTDKNPDFEEFGIVK